MTRVGRHRGDGLAGLHLDVRARRAPSSCTRGSFGLNIAKSSGPASTRITLASLRLHARVVLREVAPVELGDRAGRLDPGRAAAHDDDVESAVLDQARVPVGGLPALEQVVLEVNRVRQRVHREGVLRRAGGAEEVDLGPETEDEVVVRDRRRSRRSSTVRCVEVDRGHPGLVDRHVAVALEQVAQRVPDGGRLEQAACELVEERLEGVVVVPVDEHDVGVGALQLLSRADPGEPTAEDEDTRALSLDHRDLPFLKPRLDPPGGRWSTAPGSSRISESPVRNAFGGHVIGSTAMLRRSTSGERSPVKTMR